MYDMKKQLAAMTLTLRNVAALDTKASSLQCGFPAIRLFLVIFSVDAFAKFTTTPYTFFRSTTSMPVSPEWSSTC